MSVYVSSSHTQWAVGQGFFRTGSVASGNLEIQYAYDCGSFDAYARSREIQAAAGRNAGQLDMVYISHFHSDHVNGLPLLASAVGIRRFIIPLVPPAERIVAFAASLSGGPSGDDPGTAAWYENFIIDPVSALASVGDNSEILQLEPGGADLATGAIGEAEGTDEVKFVPPAATSLGTAAIALGATAEPDDFLWIWAPYVLRSARSGQRDFVRVLARELSLGPAILLERLNDSAELKKIVLQERPALVRAYNAAAPRNLNLTSLLLYSGLAIRPIGAASHWRSRGGGVDRPEIAAWDVQPGWLGTGDAPLGDPVRVQEMHNHYREALPGVGAFGLPHHGSRRDFSPALLSMFGSCKPTCFVGVGLQNQYGHPHSQVVQAVSDHGSHFVAVTANDSSRWTSSATTRL